MTGDVMKTYLQSVKGVMYCECVEMLDYWVERAIDWDEGGIMTCLDRDGSLWNTVKPGWFQGRSLFSFAKGYNDIKKNPEWLRACHKLYDFICKHVYIPGDPHGHMYFMLDKQGNGFKSADDLFTETFALMGMAEYYKATGDEEVLQRVRRIYDESLQFYYRNPRFFEDGSLSIEKEKMPLSWCMMCLCSVQTMRGCDPEREAEYSGFLREVCEDVYRYYYNEKLNMIVELDYDPPGHTCEVLWFMLAEGLYQKDEKLVRHMAEMTALLMEKTYDFENGGLPLFKSFFDLPDRTEGWDIRRWWVQVELMLALIYSWAGTKDEKFLQWYRMVHEYVFAHFPDRMYGEWYGYIRQNGTPATDVKGDELKGPYHLPRCFIAIYNLLDTMGY